MEELKGFRNHMENTTFKNRNFGEKQRQIVHQRYRDMKSESTAFRRKTVIMPIVSVIVCALFFFITASLVTDHTAKLDPNSGNALTKSQMVKASVLKEANIKGEVVSYLKEGIEMFDSKTDNLEYMLRLIRKGEKGEPFQTNIYYIKKNRVYKNKLTFDGKRFIYKNTVPGLGELKTYQCKALEWRNVVLTGCKGEKEGNDVLVVPTTISDSKYAEARE
ncbi:hypothetical protein P4361_05380 [Fictibacillus sp. B-59209]|uniref:hypothetical protein n=1 Tax=Fictibacillus sp. B-59209 TaxID=3024873 RepID=UPI002E1C293C|nr:hypothetical protein [Fictibacillus sp. B-59209]